VIHFLARRRRRYAYGQLVWVAVQHDADPGPVVPGVILSFDHGYYVVRVDLGDGGVRTYERGPHDLYPRRES
jgi:hypothetical protein